MEILEKLNFLNKLNIDDISSTFLGLERRLQIAVVAGLVIAVLFVILLPLSWVMAKLNEKGTEYEKYVEMVAEFHDVAAEYASLDSRLGNFQGPGGSAKRVSDAIYEIAEQSGIEANKIKLSQNTANLNTGESFTEIGQDGRIQQVPLEAVLKFLQGVEDSKGMPLKIKKIEMKVDTRNRQFLRDVNFTISTVKSNKEKEQPSE